MRVRDWLARTTMLVLAAFATLALIGSLASVSNSPIGDVFPGDIAAPAEPAGQPRRSTDRTIPRFVEPGQGTMTIEPVVATPAPPAEREVVRGLKALTYAVLALAVFAAVGAIALARIAGYLRRIADR